MGDTHWTHDHTNQTVLLYYVNTEWLDSWGGETLFFDNFNKDIVYGSSYTPNRVLVFDGEIPHTIRPPSKIFPHKFRFTLTLLFNQPYTTLTLNERNE